MHTPCVGVTRQDTSGAGRQCTLPSSLTRCHLPLQGRLCERPPPLKASPCRGGGCAVRRRRRGTALSWAFTPAVWQALAAGWPCRIACWRVVCPKAKRPCAGSDACTAPQPLRRLQCCPAGEIARPTDQGKRQAEQGTSSLRPAFIYLVARSRQIVGRAFTPAAWGLAALPVGVFSGPKAKRGPAQGRCLHRPATPAAAPMLPGGRNRPPYNIRQKPPLCGRVHLLGTRFR